MSARLKGWIHLASNTILTFLIAGILTAWTPTPPSNLATRTLTILNPGDTSHVTSPIQVEAEMKVGENGAIRLELIDEDGRVIARKAYAYHECDTGRSENASPWLLREPATFCGGQSVHLSTSLVFGIVEESQAARLQIAILNNNQRIAAQDSTSLILMASGKSKIVSPPAARQGITITLPQEGGSVSGRELVIAGEAPLTNILPMRVEVITAAGKMLGSRMVRAVHTDEPSGDPLMGSFHVEMPIKMKTEQQVIITVTAADEKIPGDRYVTSRSVTLLP